MHKFESHTDSLINYIRYWQSEGESRKTSMRIKTRLDQMRAEGLYTGGPVRYGYRAVEKGRLNKKNKPVKDLEIDPEEAAIVTITHDYKKALEEKNDLAEDLNLYDPDPEYEGEFEVYIKIYDKDLNLIRDTDNEYYWVRLGKHPDILAKVTYKDLASFLYDENTVYCSKKTDEDYIFIDTDCGKDKDEIIDYARKMAKQYLCSEGGREYIKPFIRYEYGDNDDDGPIIDRKLASLDKEEQ